MSKLECNMLQDYDICTEVLSKLLFFHNSKIINLMALMALGPILKHMLGAEEVDDEALLS